MENDKNIKRRIIIEAISKKEDDNSNLKKFKNIPTEGMSISDKITNILKNEQTNESS